MPDRWQTYPLEFKGGLITNLSPLQHGSLAPGSARTLTNFEPSIEGGYRRIEGFTKFNPNAVTGTSDSAILGLGRFRGSTIAARSQDSGNPHLYLIAATGTHTDLSELTATATTNGAVSSSASVTLDGNVGTIVVGMTVTGTGITGSVTVSAVGSQTSITLSSAQSISNDVVLTFKKTTEELTSNITRVRFATFNFDGDEDLIIVDGGGYPCILTGATANGLSKLSTPNDLSGSSHVTVFKNIVFLGNDDKLIFSAPYSATDYTPASGGGIINVGSDITSLEVFRDQLIVFCENKIFRLVGSSFADFQLQPITENIGCINGDTVQELGGDVVFLAQDSIRTLSATDRVGDFNLASVSKNIQNDFSDFIQNHQLFSSIVIPSKTQYRIFGFSESISEANARGFIGTQVVGQSGVEFNWSKTTGIRARVATDSIEQGVETAVFANTDGFIYKMESGNNFDGDNIKADFATPFFPISDPRTRKTIYKTVLYTDPQGSFSTDFNLKFDLAESGIIQPDTISISNSASGGSVSLYGTSGARFAHGGLFNGAKSTGVSTGIVIDTLSFDDTEGLTVGDTFRVNGNSQIYEITAISSAVSGSAGSATVTVTINPSLVEDVSNNERATFTKIAGIPASTYSGATLKKVFETQTVGSGFLVSMSFATDSTDPPYSLDAASLEYGQYGRR